MVLIHQKEWYNLTQIQVPPDIRSLIKKCMRLNNELKIIRIALRSRVTFPHDYIISLRSQMHSVLTSYLNFLKQFVADAKKVEKIEKEIIELRTSLSASEDEIRKQMGDKDRYFFNLSLYIMQYYEFIDSYIFDTIREAEEEYMRKLRPEIAKIMLRKVGVIRYPIPEEEERRAIRVETKGEKSET